MIFFFFKETYGSFLWIRLNCLKSAEPLQGDSLRLAAKFPRIPGTHLINLRRMTAWVNLRAT